MGGPQPAYRSRYCWGKSRLRFGRDHQRPAGRVGSTAAVGTCGDSRLAYQTYILYYLQQLGLDQEKLTYLYAGGDFRLTDVHGQVVRDILT